MINKLFIMFSLNIMNEDKHKMLFIPYDVDDKPRIVYNKDDYNACANGETQTEGYAISPSLSLLCQSYYMGNPNPHLIKYGASYPGACLIIKESVESGQIVDVDDNLYDQLYEIFEVDKKQRELIMDEFIKAGFKIMKF